MKQRQSVQVGLVDNLLRDLKPMGRAERLKTLRAEGAYVSADDWLYTTNFRIGKVLPKEKDLRVQMAARVPLDVFASQCRTVPVRKFSLSACAKVSNR